MLFILRFSVNNDNKDDCENFSRSYIIWHVQKLYMRKAETVIDIGTHKVLRNFEIKTNNTIPVRRQRLVVINKKKQTCQLVPFVDSSHRGKGKIINTLTLLEN